MPHTVDVMDRKLSENARGMLRQLRQWPNGYVPCKGTESWHAMEELVAKSYAHKVLQPLGHYAYYPGLAKQVARG